MILSIGRCELKSVCVFELISWLYVRTKEFYWFFGLYDMGKCVRAYDCFFIRFLTWRVGIISFCDLHRCAFVKI